MLSRCLRSHSLSLSRASGEATPKLRLQFDTQRRHCCSFACTSFAVVYFVSFYTPLLTVYSFWPQICNALKKTYSKSINYMHVFIYYEYVFVYWKLSSNIWVFARRPVLFILSFANKVSDVLSNQLSYTLQLSQTQSVRINDLISKW